ncbi:MAG: sensor histidine kinase [Armatimonadetes bacterium]|nr:sensor histidine kinase [Armatimonadota bacterium]
MAPDSRPEAAGLLALLASATRADAIGPEGLHPVRRAFATIRRRFPRSDVCLLLKSRGPQPRAPICLSSHGGTTKPAPERGGVVAGLLQLAALHARPLVLEPDSKPRLPDSCRDEGYEWAVPLPFRVHQRVIGGLVVAGPAAPPSATEMLFLESLSGVTSLGLLAARSIPLTENQDVNRALDVVLEAQEAERARISRELHDGVNQALTTLILRLGAVDRLAEDETVKAELQSARDLATQVLGDVRRVARDLRPAVLDEMGLGPALEALCRTFTEQHGVHAEAYHLDVNCPCRSRTIDLALYRIVQEALANVARHARATQVGVVLACREGVVTVQIEDNGVGFDPKKARPSRGHLGIVGMQERAALLGGRVSIESRAGHGTTVYAEIPADFRGLEGE